jgi:hypothetical protein
LFGLVLLVVPSEPGHDDGEVGIAAINQHLADLATIPIQLLGLDLDGLAKDQGREQLLGALAKGLRFFRRIDARQANLVLSPGPIKHSDGVAVGDGDHLAHKCLCPDWGHQHDEQKPPCHSPIHMRSPSKRSPAQGRANQIAVRRFSGSMDLTFAKSGDIIWNSLVEIT